MLISQDMHQENHSFSWSQAYYTICQAYTNPNDLIQDLIEEGKKFITTVLKHRKNSYFLVTGNWREIKHHSSSHFENLLNMRPGVKLQLWNRAENTQIRWDYDMKGERRAFSGACFYPSILLEWIGSFKQDFGCCFLRHCANEKPNNPQPGCQLCFKNRMSIRQLIRNCLASQNHLVLFFN